MELFSFRKAWLPPSLLQDLLCVPVPTFQRRAYDELLDVTQKERVLADPASRF